MTRPQTQTPTKPSVENKLIKQAKTTETYKNKQEKR